ncbi:3'(2'),5'-bisphosphate nucleotidase CysQ [Nitrosococcus wardiae]|uniref:3'(2'),5'-bisphosphate nucleotidase CysQ n=1 Tax=Nitrosococcus wardiae TaxID=1814290 RepID=A0A4P7BZ82_9GAMM|nr:3'(2'),5'-bisphosphate nucleotidase CysQ [Nitrosococcus wardiae]QBQ54579.1 3'(2'),5'-bisphosphate nucleotidase CysQ [Nitrosococcus wardiae]
MPRGSDPAALLEPVMEIAIEAGEQILAVYKTAFVVEHKEDCSPLTEADLASHNTIVQGLATLTPGVPVLSEESKEISFAERHTWQRYWLVDPLDGTREFVKRNGEFTVNIALIEDHQPVLGVVYGPVMKVLYYASRGQGAYQKEADRASTPLKVRPWRGGTARVVGSRSHAGEHLKAFLNKVGQYELVSMGSSLKICLVAEGQADVYPRFGLTSEWDTAAAQCVVEQAGGMLVDLNRVPLRYNAKESLVNPYFLVIADPAGHWEQFIPESVKLDSHSGN